MAIDSRERRFSMLNFGDGTHIHATVEADGTIDLDDRQHLLDCYSGIAFAGGAVARKPRIIRPFLQPTMGGYVKLLSRRS